ncbi:MAG: hypothetical protein RMK29_00430 [Myxococcales bacterium]|nr:hypothetical protein [Myxococcota bacterium]MDW8280142.1 hypothetical protein [Myxococcales bacterium]
MSARSVCANRFAGVPGFPPPAPPRPGRLLAVRGVAVGLACLGLVGSCRGRPPAPRLPTVAEASPEVVVANYAPRPLRLFPDHPAEGTARYIILGSEHPGLVAAWRPLAVVDRRPPPGYLARAGTLAWVAGHVVASEWADGRAALLVYDRDGRRPSRVPLVPPGPCMPEGAPLLQGDGQSLQGLLRCPPQRQSYVFRADAEGKVERMVQAPLAAGLLHAPEGDYLLGERTVYLLPTAGAPIEARPLGPPMEPEAVELLLSPAELLVVDGQRGRVLRLSRHDLSRRAEVRFPVRQVQRLRAAYAGDHLLVVVAERRGPATELLGLRVPLDGSPGGAPLLLGTGPADSDHEVAPVVDERVRALLVRTHPGNTGPVVALVKLGF